MRRLVVGIVATLLAALAGTAPGSAVEPVVTVTSLSSPTVYTTVRDGYYDTIVVRFTLSEPARVDREILDSSGAVVRREDGFGQMSASAHWYEWWGYTADGHRAPVGDYRVRFIATLADGTTSTTVSPAFTIATKQVWERATVYKKGSLATPASSGACAAYTQGDRGELACRGGEYARLTYGFRIPSSAKNIVFGVGGQFTADDKCCTGMLRKYSRRPTPTLFRVIAQVSGTRQYEVIRTVILYDWLRTY